MAGSLGLAAYRAWSRRGEAGTFTPSGPRPRGELAWIHVVEPDTLTAAQDLAQRLCNARYGLNVLITVPDLASIEGRQQTGSAGVTLEQVPPDHPATVTTFLDHWAPDMALWSWGCLRPNLVQEALDRACPMALIDADTGGFDGRRDRWIPDVTRQLLSRFSALIVRSTRAAARLEQLGLPIDEILRMSPLQAGGQALPCIYSDVAELSASLAGRPVWLATGLQEAEVPVVLAAHRATLRLSHRLLLILHLDDGIDTEACAQMVQSEGFRVMRWPAQREPDDSTQVLLPDDSQDLGLFYRVAPVSFLGSSLSPEHGGRNPFEAAALGSAVLYGPNVRQFLPFYTRLANAGAARSVSDAQALGVAVTRLIAPDQAATMAHAGWDVISQGAAVTDRLIDLVQNTLDTVARRR